MFTDDPKEAKQPETYETALPMEALSQVWETICEIARREEKTPPEVRQAMQEALDTGWSSQNPAVRAYWLKLFPSGKKPSVEFFILRIAELL